MSYLSASRQSVTITEKSTAVAKKNVVVGMCWLRLARLKGKHGQEGCSGVLYTHLQKRQDWVWLDRLGCTNAKITGYILFWSDSQHVWNRVKEPDIHFPGCGLSGRPAVFECPLSPSAKHCRCLVSRFTLCDWCFSCLSVGLLFINAVKESGRERELRLFFL